MHGEFPFFLFMIFRLMGTLFWIALFVLLILGLIRLLTRNQGPNLFFRQGQFTVPQQPYRPYEPQQQLSAMEILRQRYARGEIDAVTFDQMRERMQATEQPLQQQG
ncbi:MAG: SHOCT domain-containing protein [Ktedonobacteraceae bacterium]|nr:SHOCT domain-containing protein [Ktedonobacteraceae bacterium]